jgi:hypothetical protein
MQRIITIAATALVAITAVFTAAALPEAGSVEKGVDFIRTTQQPDGGFGPAGQTMDAVFAIRAAGIDPATVTVDGKSPADFLGANAGSLQKPAEAAKAALGALALGLDPVDVTGTNLIAVVTDAYDQSTGAFAEDDFSQAIAILGLACTGNNVPAMALDSLRANQVDDGGWGFGGASDPDTTAIVVQAIIATGVPASDEDVSAALDYLAETQNDDAGWGYDGESNASSTAFVIQALLAAGDDPEAGHAKAEGNPVSYLVAAQQPDGSFPGFDPAFATNQVVPALAGRTFCDAPATALASADDAGDEQAATEDSFSTDDDGFFEGNTLALLIGAAAVVLLVAAGIVLKVRRG